MTVVFLNKKGIILLSLEIRKSILYLNYSMYEFQQWKMQLCLQNSTYLASFTGIGTIMIPR